MNKEQDARDNDRYGHLETTEDTVVVYDAENHRAWIESDYAVPYGESNG